MAFSLVAHANAASANGNDVTTGAVDTSTAKLIVLFVSQAFSAGITPTDNKSNTWQSLTLQASASDGAEQGWFSILPTVGAGHTFTASTTGSFPAISMLAFSAARRPILDTQTGTTLDTSVTIQPGSITPGANNELVVTGLSWGSIGGTPASINGSFTQADTALDSTANSYATAMAYLIQTTLAATNPTWTTNQSENHLQSTIVAFREAALGGTLLTMGVG